MNEFLKDVLEGLRSSPKFLESKYFYNKKGDELFQKIMWCKEYYPTRAEMEIFEMQSKHITDAAIPNGEKIDVIEFGPGDAVKSVHLLRELSNRNSIGKYFPIDISENIISHLSKHLPDKIQSLSVHGISGTYLEKFPEVEKYSSNKKLVLFLGGNIGNFKFDRVNAFLSELRKLLSKGDMVLIGFDLKKDPQKILDAYNDKGGFTREFNLNLLNRINEELHGNFDLNSFDHFPTYDPVSGACKSYLVSRKKQTVQVDGNEIQFEKYEPIFMELSQKYSVAEIGKITGIHGFSAEKYFFDSNNLFADVLVFSV